MEWKDRKRFLGMPISFTKYKLDDKKLFVSTGLFSTVEDQLVMYRTLDVRLKRTFWDKLFGVGTVILYTADETHKEVELKRIKRPRQVRDMISDIAESERARLGIKGRELYGVADNEFDDSDN